jgi:FkbM family methyltransferase
MKGDCVEAVEPVADLQAVEGAYYRLLAERIPTRHMVDVGAHHGTALRPFLETGWLVHAFEPVEANRKQLKKCFPSHPHLIIRSEAVSSRSGSATMHLALQPDGRLHDYYHSLERIGDDRWHRKGSDIPVPVVSLGALVDSGELPMQVGFLKIDTEGHDLAVLRGLGSLASEVIGVEFWCDGHALGPSPSPLGDMVHLLGERGYPFYVGMRHRSGRTDVFRSTLNGTGGADWGNLIFFRADQHELYERIAAWPVRQLRSQPGVTPTSRIWDLLCAVYPDRDGLTLLDVGAYLGDFTADVKAWFPASRALLFEPSPDSSAALRERFAGDAAVEIVGVALSSRRGTAPFYRAGPAYNNSLLPPVQGEATTIATAVDTLDGFLASYKWNYKTIDLLKVDAQGHELQILSGASNTLRKHRPAVMAEIIYTDMYAGQDSYYDIFLHMKEMGYRLTALLHTHRARAGADAFADALFLPPHLHARVAGDGQEFEHVSVEHLQRQNEVLQTQNEILEKVCEERLQLIHRLNEIADDRLRRMVALRVQLDLPFHKRWVGRFRRTILRRKSA